MMTFRRYYLAQSSKIIIIDNDLNFPNNGCTDILIFAKQSIITRNYWTRNMGKAEIPTTVAGVANYCGALTWELKQKKQKV